MAGMTFDPELMRDFLTESGELLDQLDQDLVTLETAPTDLDLLNRVFRALHTIKGSASFLALTNLVSVAHAAETCLNAARSGQLVVDRQAMDLLLAAVDTIKRQFDDIRAARDLTTPDAALVARLTALGEGMAAPPAPAPPPATSAAAAGATPTPAPAPPPDGTPHATPLSLPPGKADLIDFFVSDLDGTLEQVERQVSRLVDDADRADAASAMGQLTESLLKTADFFEFTSMSRLVGAISRVAGLGAALQADRAAEATKACRQAIDLLRRQSKGLGEKQLIDFPTGDLDNAIEALLSPVPPAPIAAAAANPAHETDAPHAADPAFAPPPAGHGQTPAPSAGNAQTGGAAPAGANAENTIRVEVSRLETLLNLVGELVLQKNRVGATARQVQAHNLGTQAFREQVSEVSNALDRVTSDLQVAVMKTRMQPLDKLFGRYPRLIRDLARKLNKQINLEIVGGETEVDKSVIEELGDPLVHLMRNSADHGIELPAERLAGGKPETGTIRLSASNAGGHVEIRIADDGKGLRREFIARKAVEKGLYTAEQVEAMSDAEVNRIIFAAGFSTAEKISDVSGRGVGMDVVRANIEKLKGTIELLSEPGRGCTVVVKIPLTVAIMSAMLVGVGPEVYAVPLSSIVEIVKPDRSQRGSIRERPVMRLRDTVLPLVDGAEVVGLPPGPAQQPEGAGASFAVVMHQAGKRLGLMVDRLIGQQEIVIKPLDGSTDRGGPVSGATVRDDGGVSLIVDVPRLFQLVEGRASR